MYFFLGTFFHHHDLYSCTGIFLFNGFKLLIFTKISILNVILKKIIAVLGYLIRQVKIHRFVGITNVYCIFST